MNERTKLYANYSLKVDFDSLVGPKGTLALESDISKWMWSEFLLKRGEIGWPWRKLISKSKVQFAYFLLSSILNIKGGKLQLGCEDSRDMWLHYHPVWFLFCINSLLSEWDFGKKSSGTSIVLCSGIFWEFHLSYYLEMW